jgi:hypothetical protein
MLFDLRSRGRRTTVRVIYVILALVMLSGLILVGVGTGNNNGGLLNAFTNNGSSTKNNGVPQAIVNQTNQALKATKANPKSSAAWAKLVQARWSEAGSGPNYNTSTEAYTKSGKVQLELALTAWDKYLTLTNDKPNANVSTLAARAGVIVAQWTTASEAWQYVVTGSAGSGSASGFLCLAFTSYAAGNTRTGDLASTKTISIAPKLQKLQLKQELTAAQKSKTTAQGYAAAAC